MEFILGVFFGVFGFWLYKKWNEKPRKHQDGRDGGVAGSDDEPNSNPNVN